MTQEDKELLLKDLCGRLPYGVKVNNEIQGDFEVYGVCENCIFARTEACHVDFDIKKIKPYLFPLESMTEELKNFLRWKLTTPKYDSFDEESLEDLLNSNIQVIHFCYEHHIDFRGLIEQGLANDATGKNIY